MKVLMTCPRKHIGGVAHFAKSLVKASRFSTIEYLTVERGVLKDQGVFSKIFDSLKSYAEFSKMLLSKDIELVHCNTSLKNTGVWRDYPFLVISRILGVPYFVFFHGWDRSYCSNMGALERSLFMFTFNKAKQVSVLSESFVEDLRNARFNVPVRVMTTMVDEELVCHKDASSVEAPYHMLFMSRFLKEKGIDIVLDAYEILMKNGEGEKIHLHFAGSGPYEMALREKIRKLNSSNVHFHGHIGGDDKIELLQKCQFFFLPTYCDEGLPISLLEAIACGLVVLSRPMGGISSLRTDRIGMISESKDPVFYAAEIGKMISDPDLVNRIRKHNSEYGSQFFSTFYIKKLERVYEGLIA